MPGAGPCDIPAFGSIIELVERQASRRPNALALTASSAAGGEIRLSYAQLAWSASRMAAGLARLGFGRGDHVGLMMDNEAGFEAAISMLALYHLGAVAVPVNARFAAEEVAFVLGKAQCRGLVIMRRLLPVFEAVRAQVPGVAHVVTVGDGAPDDEHDWHRVFASVQAPAAGWPRPAPDDTSEILFTSGTTARPKGAVMTHSRSVAAAYGFADALSLDETDVFQSFFPFFTTASLHCVLLPSWWAGAHAVLDPGLDIPKIIDRMERERTTKYIGAPSFYIFLLDHYDSSRHDLSRLRLFDYGGASMSVEVVKRLAAAFPHVELRQTYGQTESGPAGTVLRGSHATSKLGSVGQPWPLTELRIVDDAGIPVPTGTTGEISVRSPSVMREYFDEPGLTAETLKDGWLLTGDIGYLDEDGFLYHVDRKKDMIIRGGHNIGSLEVEETFFRHPAVQEAAVVSVPHAKLGEDICAFVQLRPGQTVTADALRAFCADKLADYKIPRRIIFIDHFPRGPMGKVLKSDLRDRAIANEGAR
ncbi:class I adenylate-forming enzyme family protein [Enterovirga rhinocerotis]|uniref:3-methylmercaptopropionyl-CoA ligase n=1 Tax=Enterovirga rhinocerotis TaxID=1339210 RepID=A0A4R7BNK5_9HYPH|nr:AMP-binding protein [Enterovirga rhinocerotis]TDR85517.1 fatty-acyl-CoA synthase/long-chain acyl-CoA synthetase [Enterovirga rhinocerotis]